MRNKVNDILSRHIRDNIGIYFTVTLFFAIGLAAGAFTVKALGDSQKQNLVLYLNRFFQLISGERINNNTVFFQTLKNNFQTVFFIWLLGVTIIGIPFTLLITAFRGYIVGFTITFLIQGMGWKGVVFIAAAVLPQNIIYIPCLLIISSISMCFSLQIFKSKIKKGFMNNIRSNIFSYSTTILIIFGIMCVGSILEAYVSPYILQALSSYMMAQ